MEKLDQLLKSFEELKEQLEKSNSEAMIEELSKSIDDLRAQMKRNAAKKKRQKAEFDKEAQRKATTIKEGGDLADHPSAHTGFRSNSKQPKVPEEKPVNPQGQKYSDFDHKGWTSAEERRAAKKAAKKPKLTVIKEEDGMDKAEFEKDMSIKAKRGVREERRIETAKAKQPKISSRLRTYKQQKQDALSKGDKLDEKIKAKLKGEMDKRGFGEADATRHVIDRDRGEKIKPKKMKPLLNSIEEKNTLVKALEDAGQRESALLLKNWDELDKTATEMLEKFDVMGTIRQALGRPASGGLVEGATPDPTPPREKLNQSEDDKMGCCGMPRKTCKCEVKKEEELAKPGTMTGSQGTTLTGRGTNQEGYDGNPRDPSKIIESIKGLFGG
jgi:hypothetical protein